MNGLTLSATANVISNPGDLTDTNAICIGSKLEDSDYFTGRFYGYFTLRNSQTNNSFSAFFTPDELIAYYFYTMGFKKPMEVVNSSFSLLNQIDGYSYI